MRLKSVVPPPMSQTRIRSPTWTCLRQPSPCAVEPGVEGRLRLFEQRHVLEARAVGGAQRQLARLLVERRRHGEQHLLLGERELGPLDAASHARAQVREVARRGVDRRDLRHLLRRAPGQDRRRCGSTPAYDSQDLADATRRPDSRRRACARARRRRLRRLGPTAAPGCPAGKSARPAGRGTTGSSERAATSPGLTSCGMSCTWIGTPLRRAPRRPASAQLVVPRSMPTMNGLPRTMPPPGIGHFDFGGRDDPAALRLRRAAAIPCWIHDSQAAVVEHAGERRLAPETLPISLTRAGSMPWLTVTLIVPSWASSSLGSGAGATRTIQSLTAPPGMHAANGGTNLRVRVRR